MSCYCNSAEPCVCIWMCLCIICSAVKQDLLQSLISWSNHWEAAELLNCDFKSQRAGPRSVLLPERYFVSFHWCFFLCKLRECQWLAGAGVPLWNRTGALEEQQRHPPPPKKIFFAYFFPLWCDLFSECSFKCIFEQYTLTAVCCSTLVVVVDFMAVGTCTEAAVIMMRELCLHGCLINTVSQASVFDLDLIWDSVTTD